MTARVGFIGLGDMGGAMAQTIVAAGHDLLVFDLSTDAVARLVEKGASASASSAALAAECAHIAICVPDDAAVMDVVSGDDGILDSCKAGTSIVVHSTVHPDTVRDLAALASERDVVLFDAGVAGGTDAARQGDLSIMVGVPEGGVPELAQSVLDSCAGAVFEGGPVGTGMAMKVAFNVMTYFQQAALSASTQIMVGEGSDPATLLESWRHIGALSPLTERFFPLVTMSSETKTGDLGKYLRTTIAIAEKDLDLAVSLGLETGRPMPVVEAVRDSMNLVYGMPED